MPAKSKSQQRFFGVVEAYLKGKIKHPSESVRRAAKSMSPEDVKHFASTKHEGLPEKVAAWIWVFKRQEKAGQVREVDPYRRRNIGVRAQKVLDEVLSPEDSDEEYRRNKKELEEKTKEDVEAMKDNVDALARAISVIKDILPGS